MKSINSAFLIGLFLPAFLQAQNLTQSIRGTVSDQESRTTLPGANILLFQDTVFISGTVTDLEGNFRIEGPVGRLDVVVRYIGYKDFSISDMMVSSGKEVILNIFLEESAQALDEVTITAFRKGDIINDMATVSVRSFTVEETDRYAGSRGDPARMASNFAGVQGADDSRNDLVIRGNSPIGVLWRLENVDIPNPNHFAIAGTTGGPVSIINNKYLSNSDFFTSAFPAEYGNATAGVFDLLMRKGNDEQFEFSGQLGFLGTEIFAEGPLNKEKKSSFLVSYRYSTLQLFQSLNIQIGTSAVPQYQDAAFKLNFPTEKGMLSLFAIGGLSNIDILVSDYTSPEEIELYGDSDRDQYFGTSMAVIGIGYGQSVRKNSYAKFTLAYTYQENHANHELVFRDAAFMIDSIIPNMGYSYQDQKLAAILNLQTKLNNKNSLKSGITLERYFLRHLDSNLNLSSWMFDNRYDYQDGFFFLRGFTQWKHKFNDQLHIVAGLHAALSTINSNSQALEPRLAAQYELTTGSHFNAGVGMHSQMLPTYQYTYRTLQADGTYSLNNLGIGFMRSVHSVVGYEQSLTENVRMKLESYFQYLYDVPVEVMSSAFSLANEGSGFARFFPGTLENLGTGRNYGFELTLEKYYSNQYFFLITGSIFDSRYTGSDGVERPTNFNGHYASNLLAGREFILSQQHVFSASAKVTWAGGRLSTPIDTAATLLAKELVFIDSLTNTIQLQDYFRVDLRMAYTLNTGSITHEMAIDLVNMFNIQNVLGMTYAPNPTDPGASPVRLEYQLGFLPIFYYKIDF